MAKESSRRSLGESVEMLPVKLTSEELLERSQAIGDKHAELGAHLEKAAGVKAKLKAAEDEIRTEIERLAHILHTRTCPPRCRGSGR